MNRRAFLSAVGASLGAAAVPALAFPVDAPVVWAGIDMASSASSATVTLLADTSVLSRQIAELESLRLEAGDIPESVLQSLRGLVEQIGDELTFTGGMTARGTGELVIGIRFREGGQFDRCAAALRTLRDGSQFVHRSLV